MWPIRYLTAGESHGEALIGIIEGMPAGVPLTAENINRHLARRWLGYGRGGRSKIENDKVHIYSGIRFGKTLGSPISFRIDNGAYKKDRAGWPQVMSIESVEEEIEKITLPRPGHADLAGLQKYDFDDIRPVIDRSSARETAMRVACCSVARQLLASLGIQIGSHVVRIGKVGYEDMGEVAAIREQLIQGGAESINKKADTSETRMLDPDLTEACIEHIKDTKKKGDSLGGQYEVVITGVPPGLGSYVHWDRRLDGQLAQAIMSIQAQKAVEVGNGIAGASTYGSNVHDPIQKEDGSFTRTSNNAGGVEGGTSNGMHIIVRGFMKPIPTLIEPLPSVDVSTGEAQDTRYERSDVTSVPAASTVAEATVALVIANELLRKTGSDTFDEITTALQRLRDRT